MTYLRKFTQPQFDQILKQVFPTCKICNNTKYHICIKQICNPTRLICHQCQEQYVCSQHFVHQFIDIKYLSISQIDQEVLKYYYQLLIELQKDKEICARRLQISQNQTNKLSQSLEYINASLDMLFQRRLFHSSRLIKKQQLYDDLKIKIEKQLQEFNITENLDQIKQLVNLLKSTQFSILNQKEMLSYICDRQYELDICQSLQTKINNCQQYIKGLKYLNSAIRQEKTFSLEKRISSRNQHEIEEGCVELKLSFGYVDKYNFYALPHTLKKLSIESYKIMNDNRQFLLSTNIQQLHFDGLYHENSHTKSFIANCLKKKLKALTFYKNGIRFGFDHYQEPQNKKYQLRRIHQTSLWKANKLIRQQLMDVLAKKIRWKQMILIQMILIQIYYTKNQNTKNINKINTSSERKHSKTISSFINQENILYTEHFEHFGKFVFIDYGISHPIKQQIIILPLWNMRDPQISTIQYCQILLLEQRQLQSHYLDLYYLDVYGLENSIYNLQHQIQQSRMMLNNNQILMLKQNIDYVKHSKLWEIHLQMRILDFNKINNQIEDQQLKKISRENQKNMYNNLIKRT